MDRIACSVLAALVLFGPARAADLYDAPAPMLAPAPVGSDWDGIYAGVHGGYGWAGDRSGVALGDPATAADDFFFESDISGPVLGGQIGINRQLDLFVLGAEADASWSGLSADEDELPNSVDDDAVGFLGSARVRAGVGFDRVHVYGTGGIGVAGISDSRGKDEVEFGWSAGAGGEYLVSEGVSVGAQYLHHEFGDDDDVRADAQDSFDGSVDSITGRVNFRIGNPGS